MRRREGVAVKTSVNGDRTNLIDDREVAHVDVDASFDAELPRRAHDGQPRCHRT